MSDPQTTTGLRPLTEGEKQAIEMMNEEVRQSVIAPLVEKQKSAAYNEAATSGDVQVVESHQPNKREKFCHIGAPKCFALEQAMQHVNAAFNSYGSYTVGSVLDRPDWRDVDVRMIMSDEDFAKEFPDAEQHWEQDEKWLLLTVAISGWLSKQTGLPIDFQFQPQTHANKRHKGKRNAVGLRFGKKEK